MSSEKKFTSMTLAEGLIAGVSHGDVHLLCLFWDCAVGELTKELFAR